MTVRWRKCKKCGNRCRSAGSGICEDCRDKTTYTTTVIEWDSEFRHRQYVYSRPTQESIDNIPVCADPKQETANVRDHFEEVVDWYMKKIKNEDGDYDVAFYLSGANIYLADLQIGWQQNCTCG